ncbi:unnamed protein product [Cunninghamella blakesleeana]
MELALFNAIAHCKPVGIHKHFRIMCVQRQFNQQTSSKYSIQDIWDLVGEYYGISALDELEEEDQQEQEEEEDQQNGEERQREFSLPAEEEYEQIMSDHRQDTRESSPGIERQTKRTRLSKRDVSPAVTESSVASTPEPEEGKPSRRTSRSTRKSDANTPEPNTRTTSSSSRRSNRTSTASSSKSASKRQNKRK